MNPPRTRRRRGLARCAWLRAARRARDAPTLARRGALTTWKVFDDVAPPPPGAAAASGAGDGRAGRPGLRQYARADDVPPGRPRAAPLTLFPPTDPTIREQLAHCMRFVPHDADTSAFFVAVLRKAADAPPTTASPPRLSLPSTRTRKRPPPPRRGRRRRDDEPAPRRRRVDAAVDISAGGEGGARTRPTLSTRAPGDAPAGPPPARARARPRTARSRAASAVDFAPRAVLRLRRRAAARVPRRAATARRAERR